MADYSQLTLPEEVLLLALRDEKGTIAAGTMYHFALGGAIIAELLLRDCLVVDTAHTHPLVHAESDDDCDAGGPLLEECLQKIRDSKKPKKIDDWVSKFAHIGSLKHRIAERLCGRGILREEESKVLFVFSRTVYPEQDHAPEDALINRLRDAIFQDEGRLDPRTVVLISLASQTEILPVVFDKKELKGRAQRIEQIAQGEATGEAAAEAIKAMQAAVMVATIVPAIAATTIATSN